jgi:hypothetical protein
MMKVLLLICLLSLDSILLENGNNSIEFKYPSINLLSDIKGDQWLIKAQEEGDLDGDGQMEKVFVLEYQDSVAHERCGGFMSTSKPRIIVVFAKKRKNQFVAIEQNNWFIARSDEGGMLSNLNPEIKIDDGGLTIDVDYTRATSTYIFKKSGDGLFISKVYQSGVSGGRIETMALDFKSKLMVSKTGTLKDDEFKSDTLQLDNLEPKSLSEFSCMYEWEIAENVFL